MMRFRKAITKLDALTGGQIAAMGLIGFIIFGNGIIGIMIGVLTGLADYISGWISDHCKHFKQRQKCALGSQIKKIPNVILVS